MKNLSPNEVNQTVADAIGQLNVSPPPPDLASRSLAGRHRFGPWLAAGLTSAMGVIGFLIVAAPTQVTFAQVIDAQKKVTRYRITNRRLLGGGRLFHVEYVLDGVRWRIVAPSHGAFGDSKKSVEIFSNPPQYNFAVVDAPSRAKPFDTNANHLLRKGATPSIQRGLVVDGRKVDRFSLEDTYRDRGHVWKLHQGIDADPETHHVLHMEETRDSGSWGDSWDFSYDPIPEADLTLPIPKDAHIYNLADNRKELRRKASESDSVVIADETGLICVLFTKRYQPGNRLPATLTLDGFSKKLTSTWDQQLFPDYTLGGRHWQAVTFMRDIRTRDQFATLMSRNYVKGTLTFPTKQVSVPLGGMPVIRTGIAGTLLSPFMTGFVSAPK